jgi:RNA polymerase sigma factor (TIGR02999 family)
MGEATQILAAIRRGEPQAADQLLPLVYDELRRLAAQKLSQETPGQTLQATALVHEAYLRLVDVEQAQEWDSRGHFFAAAAEAMRRILVENARRKKSLKRGGDWSRQRLDDVADVCPPAASADILALHEALDELAKVHEQAAELVKLRYFCGLTIPEVAKALNVSPRTADNLWAYARAWLYERIGGDEPPLEDG